MIPVDINATYKVHYAEDKGNKKVFSFVHDPTYTITFNTDNQTDIDKFYKIMGIDTSNLPDAYTIQYVKFVQARKHKKRRINKKWLKRYGYKQIFVESKGWKMKTDTNGNVEFVK